MSSYSHCPNFDAFSPTVALMYRKTPAKEKTYLKHLFSQLTIAYSGYEGANPCTILKHDMEIFIPDWKKYYRLIHRGNWLCDIHTYCCTCIAIAHCTGPSIYIFFDGFLRRVYCWYNKLYTRQLS